MYNAGKHVTEYGILHVKIDVVFFDKLLKSDMWILILNFHH